MHARQRYRFANIYIYIFRGIYNIYIHNIIRFLSGPTRVGYKIDNNNNYDVINISYTQNTHRARTQSVYNILYYYFDVTGGIIYMYKCIGNVCLHHCRA